MPRNARTWAKPGDPSMKISVVTDSASNLPRDLAEQSGITLVPMILKFGARALLDGVDMPPELANLYQRLLSGEGPDAGSDVERAELVDELAGAALFDQ